MVIIFEAKKGRLLRREGGNKALNRARQFVINSWRVPGQQFSHEAFHFPTNCPSYVVSYSNILHRFMAWQDMNSGSTACCCFCWVKYSNSAKLRGACVHLAWMAWRTKSLVCFTCFRWRVVLEIGIVWSKRKSEVGNELGFKAAKQASSKCRKGKQNRSNKVKSAKGKQATKLKKPF